MPVLARIQSTCPDFDYRLRASPTVPKEGFEPSRPYGRRILSPLRLPFRHFGSRAELYVARYATCHAT
jgi:hypothetical protein